MDCPYCLNKETKVVDKRNSDGIAKRRRECLKCNKRFNTLESLEHVDLRVLKKDGRREDFNRDKLKRGIEKACEKLPVETEKINRAVANIEDNMIKKGKEVKTEDIGEMVSKELKKLNKVAYIRFASVYKEFVDLNDFKQELRTLK
ncbi:transcriptional regulator NrdR [Candidatus Pacearchaeota archaeon]|nr:transcriptional regulator NrdR [Candidatus Pacearchaeota archaeon]|tara:strand:- start:14286 stop:14723 length:438 start_codon:yes stop_codon:yes gene_type:complete